MAVFRLTMFPARDGDCLLVSYGTDDKNGGLRHLLVDGGRRSAYALLKPRLKQIADAGEKLELLVLTHIDADHIEGLLAMGEDNERPLTPKQVWFNGYEQMNQAAGVRRKAGGCLFDSTCGVGLAAKRRFQRQPGIDRSKARTFRHCRVEDHAAVAG